MEGNLLELDEMGCFFKDGNFSVGLVDFPSQIDGETVFLCWRSDESGLSWYHTIDEGFQGRRPLPNASPFDDTDGETISTTRARPERGPRRLLGQARRPVDLHEQQSVLPVGRRRGPGRGCRHAQGLG